MHNSELLQLMTFRKEGKEKAPLFATLVNDSFIVAVYQGAISEYDILIKYRQKAKRKWSRIRTPKHIHWAVDILIKMHSERAKTKKFLDFLINTWNRTKGIKSEDEQKRFLTLEYLLETNKDEIRRYEELGEKGEYSIKFLILLAKLLMIQEKTNLETAYMFKNLLDTLKHGEDIFRIVSTATHTGR